MHRRALAARGDTSVATPLLSAKSRRLLRSTVIPYRAGVTPWGWLGVAALTAVTVYGAFCLALLAAGRRTDARAWVGLVPDCAVLCARLVRDERVLRRHKLLLAALVAYLALPVDLVPDFVPVVGALDDAIIVAVVLRALLRGAGSDLVREHWPGPEPSLELVLRLAGDR